MTKILQKIEGKWKLTTTNLTGESQSELDLVLEVFNTPFDEGYAVASNKGSVDKNPYAPNTKAYTQWLSGFWAGFDE